MSQRVHQFFFSTMLKITVCDSTFFSCSVLPPTLFLVLPNPQPNLPELASLICISAPCLLPPSPPLGASFTGIRADPRTLTGTLKPGRKTAWPHSLLSPPRMDLCGVTWTWTIIREQRSPDACACSELTSESLYY